MAELGTALIGFGILLVLAGALFLFIGRVPLVGRLPGDIAVQRGNFGFSFPIVTCILASIGLTVLLNVAARLFR